ncbi:MAG: phenylhydantoinase [Candidatus Bathyarchaeota archaeon BA1]|nr:MAG: phenylhydantoinase [Candidatus Bathyarchaeota archaeon BA1]
MPVSLIIRNGKLVTDAGIIDGVGIAIDEEKIVSVGKDPHLPREADVTIDANGNYIMPGTIDPHTHIMEPGFEWRSDWKSETEAAAVGGVTLVVDHAWNVPPALRSADFKRKIEIAGGKAVVDFALHGGATPQKDVFDAIPEIVRLGAASLKMFLCVSVPEYPEVDDGSFLRAMNIIAKNDGIASVHAENKYILYAYEREVYEILGRKDPLAHHDSRPSFAEGESTDKAIKYAEHTSCPLYIVHMSAKEAVEALEIGKRRGIKVYGETCPQYLLFTIKDMERMGPYLKCNPPIRSREHMEALWKAVQHGVIDCIGTDHCAYLKREKEPGWEDIRKAAPGFPGLAEKTAAMLTKGVLEGKITLMRFIDLCCEKPARIFGWYPRKGVIQVGSDADVIIVDMKERVRVSLERLHTRSEFTPYDGWELTGWPTHTIVRGTIVYQEKEVVGKPGFGKYTPRKAG